VAVSNACSVLYTAAPYERAAAPSRHVTSKRLNARGGGVKAQYRSPRVCLRRRRRLTPRRVSSREKCSRASHQKKADSSRHTGQIAGIRSAEFITAAARHRQAKTGRQKRKPATGTPQLHTGICRDVEEGRGRETAYGRLAAKPQAGA